MQHCIENAKEQPIFFSPLCHYHTHRHWNSRKVVTNLKTPFFDKKNLIFLLKTYLKSINKEKYLMRKEVY